jgi:hypothetical protein
LRRIGTSRAAGDPDTHGLAIASMSIPPLVESIIIGALAELSHTTEA